MLAEKANSNDNSFFKKILLGGTEKSKKKQEFWNFLVKMINNKILEERKRLRNQSTISGINLEQT